MKLKIVLAIVAALSAVSTSPLLQAAHNDDARIVSAAKHSYVYRTYLKDDDIRIQSKDGSVTLQGEVSDPSHKAMAEDTVENLPGVKTRQWTLLVQGVNLHDAAAAELMGRFRFVPDARLDDLMISYATDGGGVGPHFDSYDVFLLQVSGRRRWRISSQTSLELIPDMPLKILADFNAEQEWVLEPGDMLYLPPQYAHDGIAEGECMTCSIGFRAPAYRELAGHFLAWLSG